MARLPKPGADDGKWGTILNDFLTQSLNSDGSLKSKTISASQLAVNSSGSNGQVLTKDTAASGGFRWTTVSGGGSGTNLSSSSTATIVTVASNTGTDAALASATTTDAGVMSAADKTKLNGIAAGAEANTVDSVAGKTGVVTLNKADVGLSNVDNTSDANKPISTATATALSGKEPSITGGTTSEYWRGDKSWQTLDKGAVGLANVNNTSDANKPISTATQAALDDKANSNDLATVATSGSYDDLADKPTIPAQFNPIAGNNVTLSGTYPNITFDATPGAGVTDLSVTRGASSVTIVSSTGDDALVPAADATDAGVMSAADKTKLNGIASGAQVNAVDSVAGKTGAVTLNKSDVGLANVDNTSDANKPVSTATATALSGKEPSITGGTTSEYWRGDKSWQTLDKGAVGLSNVNNTNDASKPISTATQTALDAKEDLSYTLNAQTGTTYTLVASDAAKFVTLTNASAITVTVPTNASVAFPVGTRVSLAQMGAGQVTFAAAGGVSLYADPGLKIAAQYGGAELVKLATNTWLLVGRLAA